MMHTVSAFLKRLRGKKIHVIGITGAEGAEMALFMARHGVSPLTLHDFSEPSEIKRHFRNSHSGMESALREKRLKELLELQAHFHWKDTYLQDIEQADIIFVPQSWYLYECNAPLIDLEHTKEFWNLTKMYFHLFPGKIIAITGSNGKTTTTQLIHHIFSQAAFHRQLAGRVFLSGNDRRMEQIMEPVADACQDDTLILEVSNRQLRVDMERSPDIGIITNITPNHLHEYHSFHEYRTAKESLLKYQDTAQTAILNYDDPESQGLIGSGRHQVFGWSTGSDIHEGACMAHNHLVIRHGGKDQPLCRREEIAIPGIHNLANCLAAAAAAFMSHIPVNTIGEALMTFRGVPQRMEPVGEIHARRFYNDTAATTPESTLAAISSFPDKSILIMGGKTKGGDYAALCRAIPEKVHMLILIQSPLADDMKNLLQQFSGIHMAATLKDAVHAAYAHSEEHDIIIFSPGGEYFSYFQNSMPGYRNFRTFVHQLAET